MECSVRVLGSVSKGFFGLSDLIRGSWEPFGLSAGSLGRFGALGGFSGHSGGVLGMKALNFRSDSCSGPLLGPSWGPVGRLGFFSGRHGAVLEPS